MLAVDLGNLVSDIEIGTIVAVLGCDVGVERGFPFAPLDNHYRIRNERVAADVVEMEMRVDNDVDICRMAVEGGEPRADLLARPVVELKTGR